MPSRELGAAARRLSHTQQHTQDERSDSRGMLELDSEEAASLASTLRATASSIRDNLCKKLEKIIDTSGPQRSLDKSGSEIQAEALQISLLMHGRPATPDAQRALIAALRADERLAAERARAHGGGLRARRRPRG